MVTINETTAKMLKEFGLDITSVDPISLNALNEYMATACADDDATADANTNADADANANANIIAVNDGVSMLKSEPILRETNEQIKQMKEQVPVMKKSNGLLNSVGKPDESNNEITLEFVDATDLTGDESLTQILQQLKLQTQVIVDMRDRLDNLTSLVHHLAHNQMEPPIQQQQQQQQQQPRTFNFTTWGQTRERNQRQPQPQVPVDAVPVQVPRAQRPPDEQRITLFGHFLAFFSSILTYLKQSRLAQLLRVILALHRRHVRIEGGMIFKVLLMVAIFSAKTMSPKKKSTGFWSYSMKHFLVITLIIAGFFLRAGYAKMIYELLTEDYIGRVYRGQDIQLDEIPQPRPPRERQNVRNLIPQNILGGRIPNPVGAINPLLDFFILIGSFFLSILPMWNPQAAPIYQPVPPPPPPQEEPVVAPPRDMDEFAASDDEEEEEEEED